MKVIQNRIGDFNDGLGLVGTFAIQDRAQRYEIISHQGQCEDCKADNRDPDLETDFKIVEKHNDGPEKITDGPSLHDLIKQP
jgi:hypothetical protein